MMAGRPRFGKGTFLGMLHRRTASNLEVFRSRAVPSSTPAVASLSWKMAEIACSFPGERKGLTDQRPALNLKVYERFQERLAPRRPANLLVHLLSLLSGTAPMQRILSVTLLALATTAGLSVAQEAPPD